MSDKSINVLLIEDNPDDALLIEDFLSDLRDEYPDFRLQHVDRLSKGIEALDVSETDVVLLDLGLPDSDGVDTVKRFI